MGGGASPFAPAVATLLARAKLGMGLRRTIAVVRFDRRDSLDTKMSEKKQKSVDALLENSSLYQRYLAERDEILRHKWLESEKEGHDIGFERALVDWVLNHRSRWRKKHTH